MSREILFSGGWGGLVKDEATESILRRLNEAGVHLYMPNPLIGPAYLNINTKMNIFSSGASLTRKKFLVRVPCGLPQNNKTPIKRSHYNSVLYLESLMAYLSKTPGVAVDHGKS